MAFCKHRVMDKCKKDNMPCIFSKECCEPEVKKTTNADRIRNMSDKELADFLVRVNGEYANDCMVGIEVCRYEYYECADMDCVDCFLEWLQAEVKEGAEDECN